MSGITHKEPQVNAQEAGRVIALMKGREITPEEGAAILETYGAYLTTPQTEYVKTRMRAQPPTPVDGLFAEQTRLQRMHASLAASGSGEALRAAVERYIAVMQSGTPTMCSIAFDEMARIAQGDEPNYDPDNLVGPVERRWLDDDLLQIMDILLIPEAEQERSDQPWTKTILEWLNGGRQAHLHEQAEDAFYDTGASVTGSWDREALGRYVRHVWMEWAHGDSNTPKPSWLVHWPALPESQKEVDRQIGERLYAAGAWQYRATLEHAYQGLKAVRSALSSQTVHPTSQLATTLWSWAEGCDTDLEPRIVATLKGVRRAESHEATSNIHPPDGAGTPGPEGAVTRAPSDDGRRD